MKNIPVNNCLICSESKHTRFGDQNGFIKLREGFHDVQRVLNIVCEQKDTPDSPDFSRCQKGIRQN